MWIPQRRFTIRRLMIAVAVVAVGTAGEVTRRRWQSAAADFTARAAMYHAFAKVNRSSIEARVSEARLKAVFPDDPQLQGPMSEAEIALSQRLEAYCEILASKYEQAARHPWRAIAADPPEPR